MFQLSFDDVVVVVVVVDVVVVVLVHHLRHTLSVRKIATDTPIIQLGTWNCPGIPCASAPLGLLLPLLSSSYSFMMTVISGIHCSFYPFF